MHSLKQRGLLLLSLGFFFPVVFLLGGGVLTSTHGGYWSLIFAAGFVIGLACPGAFVYRSALARHAESNKRVPRVICYVGSVMLGLTMPLWLEIFRSGLFSTSAGQHAFFVVMGVCLAQLVPLGVGLIRADAEHECVAHSVAESVSNGELPPVL
jgi:hypothetical protein